jgi:poly-gamma-glutamate capsule biosynthesis protein CapA/YwtB (metallophosphatase superfamily)
MSKIIISVLLVLLFYFNINAQDEGVSSSGKLSLLFIGDIMGHDEQIKAAENPETGSYNYDEVFRYIKDEISEADLAIANFEVTLAGPPYKGYPTFSSPSALAAACRDAGIDLFVSANNHAADRGNPGILNTIFRLDSLGIAHTGTFTDIIARDTLYPMIIEKNGLALALLNYTYGTNGIKVPPPVVVNILDLKQITADIEKASAKNPDAIIMFLHWGTEYDTIPSKEQTEIAKYFFSRGVDIIIGSHPHVLQKMEWAQTDTGNIRDRITVFSLGNFVSNQRTIMRDGGAMVKIDLARKNDSIYVNSAGYYLTWVYTPFENNRKKFYILPCSRYENNPEFFARQEDYNKMMIFIRNSRNLLNSQNRGINELFFEKSGR